MQIIYHRRGSFHRSVPPAPVEGDEMRIEGWTMITAAAMTVCGQQAPMRLDRSAAVCLVDGRSVLENTGPGVSRIFAQIGIRIDWRNNSRSCDQEDGAILIRLSYGKPATQLEDAFGYALPYEGTHIVVFWDHVLETTRATGAQNLLAYVVAHEIGHVLERVNRHSVTGIMNTSVIY